MSKQWKHGAAKRIQVTVPAFAPYLSMSIFLVIIKNTGLWFSLIYF